MPHPAPHTNARSWPHASVLALAVAALLLSATLEVRPPDTVILPALEAYPLPQVCSLRRLTGYPCPACGMTRSFISMAHMDYTRALEYHLLGPVLFLFALSQIPYRFWRLRREARNGHDGGDKLPAQRDFGPGPRWMQRLSVIYQRSRARINWGFAAVLIAVWLYRLAAMMSGRPA